MGASVAHAYSMYVCMYVGMYVCMYSLHIQAKITSIHTQVTPNIEVLLRFSAWSSQYQWSDAPTDLAYYTSLLSRKGLKPAGSKFSRQNFPGTRMERGMLYVCGNVCGFDVIVGTSHLESPTVFKKVFFVYMCLVVCMYVCMYMYICMYIYIYIYMSS